MAKTSSPDTVAVLLAILDEGYNRPAWHGPNLRGALRGLSASEAAWVPPGGRNSAWHLALHCAYWKYATRRRLLGGGPRGAFPRKGHNFFPLPEPADERTWKADLTLLDEQHRALRETVATLDPRRLGERSGQHTLARLVYGIAGHDIYHAAQIRLLIRLSGAKQRRARG